MRHLRLFQCLNDIYNGHRGVPHDWLALTNSEHLHSACQLNLGWHLPVLSRLAGRFHEPGDGAGTLYTLINLNGEMIGNSLLGR